MIEGIDCSTYQGVIDWPKVADAGMRFAYLKASEGAAYRDPVFSRNRHGARDAGMLPGAYHFARFGNPEREANWFWACAEELGANEFELPPALDLEAQPPAGWNRVQTMLWVGKFLDKLESLCGRVPVLYTYPYYWAQYCIPEAVFGTYPLWLAQYSKTGPWHPGPNDQPTVPKPWDRWTVWQWCGSGADPLAGVHGVPPDRNLFNGSWEELCALAGAQTEPPPVCG